MLFKNKNKGCVKIPVLWTKNTVAQMYNTYEPALAILVFFLTKQNYKPAYAAWLNYVNNFVQMKMYFEYIIFFQHFINADVKFYVAVICFSYIVLIWRKIWMVIVITNVIIHDLILLFPKYKVHLFLLSYIALCC